jgi:hypothetical protein
MKTLECIPADIHALFGNPPLLRSEDPELYWRLVDRLVQAIAPKDVIEWLWLKDVADYGWEAFRLQRFKTATIDLAQRRAVETVMRRLLLPLSKSGGPDMTEQVNRLAQGWFTDPKVREEAVCVLKVYGLAADAVDAEAFTTCVDKLQAIDGLLGIAAVRRDASLREIERKRESVTLVVNTAPAIDARIVEELPRPKTQLQKAS